MRLIPGKMNSAPKRNPVLLIHGINDTAAVFHKMAPYLAQQGWSVYDLSLTPNNGAMGLDSLAQQVADYVAKTFAPDQPFDLVGFSMGGIVSRYYVQRLGGINRVQRFITISAPNHGTWAGYFHNGIGCVQMRPDSAFLQDLNRDVAMLEQLNFTSIWTPFDLIILPPNSSEMPVGQNLQVPVLLHPWMITDAKGVKAVEKALLEPLKRDRVASPNGNRQSRHTPEPRKLPRHESNI
jgi:triacylglycerol lipase